MKKLLILIPLFIAGVAFAQDKEDKVDKGYSFSEGTEFKDEEFNKLVAQQFTKIESYQPYIGRTRKVTYTGHHKIFHEYSYKKNAFGEVTRRFMCAQVALVNEKGECTIGGYFIYQDHLGAGAYTEPKIAKHFGDGRSCENGIKVTGEQWKSCACINETRNWLTGSGAVTTNVKTNNSSQNSSDDEPPKKEIPVTGPAATKSSSLKSLDKTKPGYFEEKDGGKIARMGYKKDGEFHGEVREINDAGIVTRCAIYSNGKLHGPYTGYDENGLTESSGMYVMDSMEGDWYMYYNGVLLKKVKYKNGETQE